MKSLIYLVTLITVSSSVQASNYLEFDVGKDPVSGSHQKIVLVSEAKYKQTVPAQLAELRALPLTQHTIIEPSRLLNYTDSGVKRNFIEVSMDEFLVVEHKDISPAPFLITRHLCDCVGVSIVSPGVKYGLAHIGLRGFDNGKLKQFLSTFSKGGREGYSVTLLSSYLSILVREVYDTLIKEGFRICSVDIPDYYFVPYKRASSGYKYNPYERLGMTESDILTLKKPSNQKYIAPLLEARAALNPDMAENPRIMMIDLGTGDSCQFFPRGFYCLNSDFLDFIDKIMNVLQDTKYPPYILKRMMGEALSKFYTAKFKMLVKFSCMCLNSQDVNFMLSYWKEYPEDEKGGPMQKPEGRK